MNKKDNEYVAIQKKYINEIADALVKNHAALMVGSGMSKNAVNLSSSDKRFLDWKELADKFYEKLYGEETDTYSSSENGAKEDEKDKEIKALRKTLEESEKKNYSNVLSLAEEVETVLGRKVLEDLINEAVPDESYAPSELYIKLLKLGWADVFTTNYDTLLERAARQVTNRRYDFVLTQQDLVNKNGNPRVIKLHGTLPSYRPFIVTEEDYRTYPVKQAAMVNTVQQALVENTFCMIGFSGDDPNFLHWIGWIHDNLGKSSSQKIYMVSVTSVPEAKKKLLAKRNITVVELGVLYSNVKDAYKKLDMFFNYLEEKEATRIDHASWMMKKDINFLISSKNNSLESKIETMKSLNSNYPGWIYLPCKYRRTADAFLDKLVINDSLENVGLKKQIEYLYEYAKFLDICDRPIVIYDFTKIDEIIVRYFKIKDEKEYEKEDLGKIDRQKVSYICLQMLRACREQGLWEKYREYHNYVDVDTLDYYDKQFFYANDCWLSIYKFEFDKFDKMLSDWKLSSDDVYWPLVKSKMYFLLGKHSEAADLLMQGLQCVRRNLNFTENQERLLSIEECMIDLYNHTIFRTNKDRSFEKSKIKRNIYLADSIREYNIRLREQKVNGKYFGSYTRFDLTTVITYDMVCDNRSVYYSLAYFRMLEDTCYISSSPKSDDKTIELGCEAILAYYSYLCFMQCFFNYNDKLLDIIFSRARLSSFTTEQANKKELEIINNLDLFMIEVVKDRNTSLWLMPFYNNFTNVILEILNRLYTKATIDCKEEIIDILFEITKTRTVLDFRNIKKLLLNIINSFEDSEREIYLPKLLAFPISIKDHSDYCDPVVLFGDNSIKISLNKLLYYQNLSLVKDMLHSGSVCEKKAAIGRFIAMYNLVKMKEEDVKYIFDEIKKLNIIKLIDTDDEKSILMEYFKNRIRDDKYNNELYLFDKRSNRPIDDITLDILNKGVVDEDIIIQTVNLLDSHIEKLVLTKSREELIFNNDNIEEKLYDAYKVLTILIVSYKKYNISLGMDTLKLIYKLLNKLSKWADNSPAMYVLKAFLCEKCRDKYISKIKKSALFYNKDNYNLICIFYQILVDLKFDIKSNDFLMEYTHLMFNNLTFKIASQDFDLLKYQIGLCSITVHTGLIDVKEMDNLFYDLERMVITTNIDKDDSSESANVKSECRRRACALASELYKQGVDNPIIKRWKAISEDENEFIEIRNIKFVKDVK